ncbi:hypothetical protein [Virgibacillus oceani]|uniref:Uncharacterized protein n=1 Tax=Virgibacillus oceani TaxID=1479511 RepID=A0A917M438_9BACI|nr:hypothetical protein [Virgibacillus oceani]GGG75767.1 hypothetical protein GCM10011398_20820 [Virgibacillus oceani]
MEERVLVVASKLMAIGLIVISLVVGFISFYMMSDLSKEKKKRHVEEMSSQLINFIIFIWLGKVILNFSIFLKDPLAILAYPSNSEAFYLAVLFTALLLVYKSKRQRLDVQAFIESFLHVFLVASFVYEFIQLVWNNNTYSFGYLVLLAVLLVLFFLIRGHITAGTLITTILTVWSAGVFLLILMRPFITVFGYILAPWFMGLFFIISLIIIIIRYRKRDRNGRN